MSRSALIVGGIGYLGYNVARVHWAEGDRVYIAARRSSVERRGELFRELRAFVKKTILFNDLGDRASIRNSIDNMGCPDIVYLATGKLGGPRSEMEKAHVDVPLQWARVISQRCRESLIVYISSVFAVGDPAGCSRDTRVWEEEDHLQGCRQSSDYARTKAEGERGIITLCRETGANMAILRPGLLVGEWSYHREWRLMYRLAGLRLRLKGGPYIHVAPAKDVARAAILLYEKGSGCGWYYATPWRTRLGELHGLLVESLGIGHSIPLYTPSFTPGLGGLAKELKLQQRYSIEPRALNSLGMKWTSLRDAVVEAATWMKRYWGERAARAMHRQQAVVIV